MKQVMAVIALTFCVSVQSQVLPKNFNDLTKQVEPNLIEWRRHSLDSASREIAWLDEMIQSERKTQ